MNSLLEDIADMRNDLHEELSLMIQVKIQITNTLVETTQRGLETRLVEVIGDFVQGLDIAWRDFKMQLPEVKA
jgi:hypothetical protein